MLVFAAIVPHPPESIPGVATPEDYSAINKTLKAFDQLRKDLEKADVSTIIIISPHATMEPYFFRINSNDILSGSFAQFGIDEIYSFKNNLEFADKLAFAGAISELPTHLHEDFLDHGALIPLYHLTKNISPKIVHLSFSLMDYSRHFRYGEVIQMLADNPEERVAILASGDLSHRLTPDAPAGFSEEAKNFDNNILHCLGSDDITRIINLHEDIVRESAECGIRSIVVLLGVLNGRQYKFKLLSYEYPFGVGYLTARLV